ncbi:putative F-box protein At2g02030 isoform X1 [Quercus robur]|uniref:putative F-box protein At2g02030 isoform X1 n=1 Tax=Quercus robur TaxID=38942 RepID=UPI002163E7A4|nr:putative F-box protein At2g02030 isoform X1 [Quercus robur]XP_050260642.1 putative F-box protein At2g02030 isoform X1 [Quercus robur]XP_050260643.1 putative F-box protein At2g02030 isoform X1 [Quercus robur]
MSDNLPAKVSESLFSKEVEEEEEAMWDFLPPEILPNILLRLPTKSIVKFTCVCKTWRSLIRSPDFISAHLKLSNCNQPLLLFRFCSDSRLDCEKEDNDEKEVYKLYCDNQDFNDHARFDFPFHTLGRRLIFRVVGTCNGLVCVEDDGLLDRIILWNPCVRMFVELPKPSITYQGYHEDDGYGYDGATGLGFDSKTNDYKVVRVVTVVDVRRRGDWGVYPPKVEVYSLATGEWSMVTTALPCAVRHHDPLPFVNGALHWVALRRTNCNKYHNFITVLDLGDMVFSEIVLPILSDDKDDEDESHIRPFISAYGNSLALCQEGFHTLCVNVWLMKRYADSSSWTKIVIFPHIGLRDQDINDIIGADHAEGYIYRAKGFRKSGEVVVQLDLDQRLVSQDLETQECKDLRISAYNYTFVGSYVKSLVLLDKPNRAATY